ncbi:hypothetical protein BYT27DRAFT_7103136, partial [Phlegmacium glaucopus]
WMPRNDRPKDRELYCASTLCLLKPWTDLGDLKTEEETFEESFECFVAGTKKKTLDILENIQYYYECYDGAKKKSKHQDDENIGRTMDIDQEAFQEMMDTGAAMSTEDVDVTEEDIEMAYDCRGTMRERIYAQMTMTTAIDCGVFSNVRAHTVFYPM